MISAEITPSGNAFIGNPIFLKVSGTGASSYTVSADGRELFRGSGIDSFSVNIAELFAPCFTETPWMEASEVCTRITGQSNRVSAQVVVRDESGTPRTMTLQVWKGGLSKRAFRHLSVAGSDIFTARLLNRTTNFFMTTRTAGSTVVMRETELHPLYFIHPGDMSVRETLKGNTLAVPGTAGDFCRLNMQYVRSSFFALGTLASSFEVIVSGKVVATIAIEKARPAKERHRVRFLNSFGVYEFADFVGKAVRTPTSGDEEDSTGFKVYDELVDDYVEQRDRQSLTAPISLSTGPKRQEELAWLLDMLASEDVHLELPEGEVRVRPSISEASMQVQQRTPESVTFTFTPVEGECRMTPDYGAPDEWRLFDRHFDSKFN